MTQLHHGNEVTTLPSAPINLKRIEETKRKKRTKRKTKRKPRVKKRGGTKIEERKRREIRKGWG